MKRIICAVACIALWYGETIAQDSLLYADCEIYGVSAYQADYVSGMPESSPSGRINVYIGTMTKPLVLVCSGYDPMTWNVNNPDSAEIRMVILNGWNVQSVTGIDTTVPVISEERSSYNSPEYSTSQYSDYKRLEDFVKSKTGKGFTTFQSAGDGMYFHIREPNSIPHDSCLLHSVYTYRGAGALESYKYHPRGSVTVDIGPMPAPIILQLAAYEPVEWYIENPEEVPIKAIFVKGYYQGKVTNCADSVTLYSSKGVSATTVFPVLSVATHQTAQTTGYFYINHEIVASREHAAPYAANPVCGYSVFSDDAGGSTISTGRSALSVLLCTPAGRTIKYLRLAPGETHIWQRRSAGAGVYPLRVEAGGVLKAGKLTSLE